MSMYIVDCRYIRTTTPVGQSDFTVEVEACAPEHAILLAEKTADSYGDFTATGACETLALVEMLRSHVRILAEFGLEMARKSREAGTDVAEFEALVSANGIAMPDSEYDDQEDDDQEDEDTRTERLRGKDEEDESSLSLEDLRQRAAKFAFEHYDFTAYGGVDEIHGWYGRGDEQRAMITLGGYAEAFHVLAVEFEEDTDDIIHVGVEMLTKAV